MCDPTDDQLRREGPAYSIDAGWEEVPGPLGAVMSVRFDLATMRRLARIASETGRTPSAVVRDWTLERLAVVGRPLSQTDAVRAVREAPSKYLTENERLRKEFRPPTIRWLLVGESSPASGRHFYRANSNLFRATRAAFEQALGPVPEGQAFLIEFRDRGAWLVDMADKPVNRQRGRPRATAVDAGTARLAKLLAAGQPDLVVAVKATLEAPVRRAAKMAGMAPDQVHVLPFPVRQWRQRYVDGLAMLLRQAVLEDEEDLQAVRAALADPANRTPIPWEEVKRDLRKRGS